MTDHSNKMSVSFTVVKSATNIGKQFTAPDGKTIVKKVIGDLFAGGTATVTSNGVTATDVLPQGKMQ